MSEIYKIKMELTKNEFDRLCELLNIDEDRSLEDFTYLHFIDAIDNAPTADDGKQYSDNLWHNAYERGQADAYEKAKQKVTVSVKVGNQRVEESIRSGDAIKNISYPCS